MTLGPKEAKSKPAGAEPAGPVAWWKLDETAGTTAANTAVNKLTGKIHGQPHWTPGAAPRGGALEFDGTKNWVECADSSDLDFREGVSFSTWFKVRRFDQPAQTLAAKGDAWRLQRQGDKGNLEFALNGPTTGTLSRSRSPVVKSKRAVDDGQWHHVVATYDGKRMALYLDGTEEEAVAASGSLVLNSLPMTLGENDGSRGRFFNGWMNHARLYSRGLSAEEVQALYRDGKK